LIFHFRMFLKCLLAFPCARPRVLLHVLPIYFVIHFLFRSQSSRNNLVTATPPKRDRETTVGIPIPGLLSPQPSRKYTVEEGSEGIYLPPTQRMTQSLTKPKILDNDNIKKEGMIRSLPSHARMIPDPSPETMTPSTTPPLPSANYDNSSPFLQSQLPVQSQMAKPLPAVPPRRSKEKIEKVPVPRRRAPTDEPKRDIDYVVPKRKTPMGLSRTAITEDRLSKDRISQSAPNISYPIDDFVDEQAPPPGEDTLEDLVEEELEQLLYTMQ